MESNGKSILELLEELSNNENLDELTQFVGNLSRADYDTNRAAIFDAYHTIYSYWYTDLICNKIKETDRESFVASLFEIISLMEKIYPQNIQYSLRAECYKYLAEEKPFIEEKLLHIQNAIGEYEKALQTGTDKSLYALLADAMMEKIKISGQVEEAELTEILRLFQLAFEKYSASTFSLFLHSCFQLLNLSFEGNKQWHDKFMQRLELSLSGFAKRDSIIYLDWSNNLKKVLEHQQYKITNAYAAEIDKKSLALLDGLIGYETNNTETLNDLGNAFQRSANKLTEASNEKKLHYYKISLGFFTKAHSINPAAWTFTVYATNVLIAMSRIYFAQNKIDQVKELMEEGRTFFSKTAEYDQGFTLMLNWGEYLIEYARLVYDFKAPDILKEAETRLLVAKQEGNAYYTNPYLALALIALKSGDKQKCLHILQNCKIEMSTKSFEYKFEHVLENEDFREIWMELPHIR